MTLATISEAVITPIAGTSLSLRSIAQRHEDGGGHGAQVVEVDVQPHEQRDARETQQQAGDAPRLELLVSQFRDDDRGEQRHHGDEQPGGRARQPGLGMAQQPPGQADLDERKSQQPLPLAEGRRQGVTMQRQRQQQQRTQHGARSGDYQRVDLAHGDADEQVGHAPEQAQREKQDPATF
jgi:hypothetical protein